MASIHILRRPRASSAVRALVDSLGSLDDSSCIFFFFQAEDGIRDSSVTGVQTCALPISVLAGFLREWVLGEDSGLVVPALQGRPGVYSARYAGKEGDDAANNTRLLAELAPLPDDKRAAYYVCTAALADPTGEVRAVVEGRCHGLIVCDYRGSGGFGYDPLFLIPEYHRTFGELSARVKHALSHRARALEQLWPALRQLMTQP